MVRSSWCGNKLETELAAFRNLTFNWRARASLAEGAIATAGPESEDRQSHASTFTQDNFGGIHCLVLTKSFGLSTIH